LCKEDHVEFSLYSRRKKTTSIILCPTVSPQAGGKLKKVKKNRPAESVLFTAVFAAED
jgi:hypothetical protein